MMRQRTKERLERRGFEDAVELGEVEGFWVGSSAARCVYMKGFHRGERAVRRIVVEAQTAFAEELTKRSGDRLAFTLDRDVATCVADWIAGLGLPVGEEDTEAVRTLYGELCQALARVEATEP